MGRVFWVASVCVLCFAGSASAGEFVPQDFPKAPLRVDGTTQGGRLGEVNFAYGTPPELCVATNILHAETFPRPLRVAPGIKSLRFRLNAERPPNASLRYWTEVDSEGYADGGLQSPFRST